MSRTHRIVKHYQEHVAFMQSKTVGVNITPDPSANRFLDHNKWFQIRCFDKRGNNIGGSSGLSLAAARQRAYLYLNVIY